MAIAGIKKMRGIVSLIDRFGPEHAGAKECLKQVIFPVDIEGITLEQVIEKLSATYILSDDQDGQENPDFSMENPFTKTWLQCCGPGKHKIPYVDGMLTCEQLELLIKKHAPLPSERLNGFVAGMIKPQDILGNLSFPEIVSKLRNMWYEYHENVDVLLFENPFNCKQYTFVKGDLA